MKTYFVVADVHGFADLMKKGLVAAGFDATNPDHIFVSLGDLTDRGDKNVECVEYVMSLPNRVLVRGNHDDLVASLIWRKPYFTGTDVNNGTYDTVRQFAENTRGFHISDKLAVADWDGVRRDARKFDAWNKYYGELRNYFEVGNYVFVHGWIPVGVENWRQNATEVDWEDAVWAKTPQLVANKCWDENHKTIVCGHWHSQHFWATYCNKPDQFGPYQDPHFITLDSCTTLSRELCVFVVNEEGEGKFVCVKD